MSKIQNPQIVKLVQYLDAQSNSKLKANASLDDVISAYSSATIKELSQLSAADPDVDALIRTLVAAHEAASQSIHSMGDFMRHLDKMHNAIDALVAYSNES